MYTKLLNFIKYNNALPMAFSVLLLSFGGVMAASPDARDAVAGAVYATQSEVISIDNTYIANKDLDNYSPRVVITQVVEDEEYYHVLYRLTTIKLVEHVWQDVDEERTMDVAKTALGDKDLGLYVTGQLKEVIDREIAYLKEVQSFERRSITQMTVATAYSGLVGKFLDETTETLPGYQPVIPEPIAAPTEPGTPVATEIGTTTTSGGGDVIPPSIQILGNNPARIAKGSTYVDLGAVVTDNINDNLGIQLYINGDRVSMVYIDTRDAGEWTVTYKATDQAGNITTADRLVQVYDPALESNATSTPPTETPPSEVATSTEETVQPEPEAPVEQPETPVVEEESVATSTEQIPPPDETATTTP